MQNFYKPILSPDALGLFFANRIRTIAHKLIPRRQTLHFNGHCHGRKQLQVQLWPEAKPFSQVFLHFFVIFSYYVVINFPVFYLCLFSKPDSCLLILLPSDLRQGTLILRKNVEYSCKIVIHEKDSDAQPSHTGGHASFFAAACSPFRIKHHSSRRTNAHPMRLSLQFFSALSFIASSTL